MLEQSRERFAELLRCGADEVRFAPSAEAALVTAVDSVCRAAPAGRPVLVSPIERQCVLEALDVVAETRPVCTLAVDSWGRILPIDPEQVQQAAALVVQAANREIGTRQPLDALPDRRGVPLIVDATAVRSPTELPCDWDVLVLDPMVWGGPDGIAVIACRRSVPWRAQPPATSAQRFLGRVSPALAAAAAMSLPEPGLAAEEARIADLVDQLAARILSQVPHAVRLGHPVERLGYLLAISMLYVNAEQLVDDMTGLGFAVHSGSACTSDTRRPSHVLTAIGGLTQGNLRISLPPGCPRPDVEALAAATVDLVHRQRAEAGLA